MDPVIVSATDGPLPDTVERLRALAAQGATSVDYRLTHTDLVGDVELLELVELELRDLAAQNGLAIGSISRDAAPGEGTSVPYGPAS
jgi:translation elongation factor EF-Tu-like GTPase